MEIEDYLLAIRRRLWVPVVIPIVAALLTAGFLYVQPEKYQATATVVVPALSAKGYSTSAATQYFSTFKDVLTSPPLLTQINGQTREPKSDLAAGLSASTTTASSNIITVTYSGPNKSTVVSVARYAATDALDALLGPQVVAAQRALATGQAQLTQADQNLNDFTAKTGYLFPENDYRNLSQELSALMVQLSQAYLAGDTGRIKGLTPIVLSYQKKLADLAPIVTQYQNLAQQQQADQAVLAHAQTGLNDVNAEKTSNHDAAAVSTSFNGHVSRVFDILKYGAVAAGVALLLSLAFIVFMEFLRPARIQSGQVGRRQVPAMVPVIAGGTDGAPSAAADMPAYGETEAWPATWKSGQE